jgi:hypothetical protein
LILQECDGKSKEEKMKLFTYPNGQLFQFASNVRGSRTGFTFSGIGLEFSASVVAVCAVVDVDVDVVTLVGVDGFVVVAVLVFAAAVVVAGVVGCGRVVVVGC